jgi:hypothetical protein
MMHSKRPSQASVNQSSESSKALSTSSPSVSASAVNPTATATNAGAAAPAAPVTATTPPTARPPKPTSPPPQYTLQLSPQSPRATTTSSSSASQETTCCATASHACGRFAAACHYGCLESSEADHTCAVPHVGSGDASAVARVVQLSARGPTSPHRFSGVEPLLVGQDKTTVVEKVFVPPCTIVYRFENSGSLSVVNMLTQRATLLPPYPSPAIQLAVAPPYVVSLHADDTLLFYDVHTASPHWSKSLRCSDVFAEDDESVGSESVSSPSTAGDDDVNASPSACSCSTRCGFASFRSAASACGRGRAC